MWNLLKSWFKNEPYEFKSDNEEFARLYEQAKIDINNAQTFTDLQTALSKITLMAHLATVRGEANQCHELHARVSARRVEIIDMIEKEREKV